MELYELKYLLTVAEEKNISKASEKLFIAQPSLSQIINRIESRINHKIFIRSSTGLKLTREGEKFICVAKKMVELNKELEIQMKSIASSEYGRLSIGIPAFWGAYIMPPALIDFHKKYPNVEVMMLEATSSVLETMILKEEIDLAIMTLPIIFSDQIQHTELFEEDLLMAVSNDNELSKKGVFLKDEQYQYIDPELLRDQPFLSFPKGVRLRDASDRFLKMYDIEPQIVAHVMNIGTAKRLIASNLGVSFLPGLAAKIYETPSKPVYFLTGDKSMLKVKVVVAFKNRKHPNKLITGFTETVIELFA